MALLTILVIAGAQLAGAANIFSDEFSGAALNPAWQVSPGQGSYGVSGGSLRYVNQGPLSSPGGWGTTSLALAVPFSGTHWQLDTKATYNLIWLNRSGASSGAQRALFMVSFDPASSYDDYAAFDRGVDAWYNANFLSAYHSNPPASTVVNGLVNPSDSVIVNNTANGTYWYRMIRDGGTLELQYSYDGLTYTSAFKSNLSDPTNPFNKVIISGNTWESVGSYTDYDYVRIEGQAVPEPGTALPLALLLGAALVARLRKRA
jgi:hypothetical protein